MRVCLLLLLVAALAGGVLGDLVTDINCSNPLACGDTATAHAALSQGDSHRTVSCLCVNGTRVTLNAIFSANGTYEGFKVSDVSADGIIDLPGCPSTTTWSQVAPMAKQCWGESLTINGDCSRECSAVALPFGQACFVSIVTYEDLGVKTDTASAGAFYDRCASPAPTPEPAPAPGSAAPPALAAGCWTLMLLAAAALLLA